MFRKEAFRRWMESKTKLSPNSIIYYLSYLDDSDRLFDVDAKIVDLGTSGFLNWINSVDFSSSSARPKDIRSGLRKYVAFHIDTKQHPGAGTQTQERPDEERAEEVTNPRLFRMERQMQAAVRAQLEELEPGLKADDDGREVSVSTGRIDIVARDKDSKPVVIELKAGDCPAGALEQVLGYAANLEEERGEEVRAYLIAGSFSDRTRAAARRMTGLELRTYEFSVRFNPPDQV